MKKTLTDKQRQEIEALATMSDEDIDYSDIPPIREIPADAVIGKFYRPKQEVVTISLDADVLAWLNRTGEGYQTRINSYLRTLMKAELVACRSEFISAA